MNKTITVETSAGPVVVKKLALYDYAELLKKINALPEELGKLFGESDQDLKDNSKLLKILPAFISKSLPDACNILSGATDKEAEWIGKNLDLADTLEVFVAALELNDYQRIAALIKKIFPFNKQSQAPAATAEQPEKN